MTMEKLAFLEMQNKCMGNIICEIYWNENDHDVAELIDNSKFNKEITSSSIKELIKLGLVEKYCFDKGINLTPKGLELLHSSIEDGLKKCTKESGKN